MANPLNCCKYTIVNSGSTPAYFNYVSCIPNTPTNNFQVPISPNQIKYIWSFEGMLVPLNNTIGILCKECTPFNVTPSQTKTPTVTPSFTPTKTITPTMTQTVTPTVTPSNLPLSGCYVGYTIPNTYLMYTDCCDGTVVSKYVIEQTPYLVNVDLSQFYQNINFTYQISNCPTPTPTPTITSTPTITPTNTVTPSPSYIPKILTMKFNSTGNTNNWFVEGSTVFDMMVDWGDTQIEAYVASNMYNPTHTYSASGEYTCVVTFTDPTIITSLDVSTGYGDNRLVEISGLEYLTTLSYLNLSGNLLSAFTPTILTSLNLLDLSSNQIVSFNSLYPISSSLGFLYLNDNSLSNTEIDNSLIYLSGTTSWSSPNLMTFNSQLGGGCLLNPSSGYDEYLSLTGAGWTINIDIC